MMNRIDYYLQESYLEEALPVEEFSALKNVISKLFQRKNILKIEFENEKRILLKKYAEAENVLAKMHFEDKLNKLKEVFHKEVDLIDLKMRDIYLKYGERGARFAPGQ